jgi:hypothetical protein
VFLALACRNIITHRSSLGKSTARIPKPTVLQVQPTRTARSWSANIAVSQPVQPEDAGEEDADGVHRALQSSGSPAAGMFATDTSQVALMLDCDRHMECHL